MNKVRGVSVRLQNIGKWSFLRKNLYKREEFYLLYQWFMGVIIFLSVVLGNNKAGGLETQSNDVHMYTVQATSCCFLSRKLPVTR